MQLPLEIINASLVSHLFPSLESSFHFTICELFSTYRATILVKSPWDTKCKPLTQLPVTLVGQCPNNFVQDCRSVLVKYHTDAIFSNMAY